MSRLQWDHIGKRFYETGVDRVVLYVNNSTSPWSGITAINESTSGAEPTKIYADNIVYGVVMSPEEVSVTIESFGYPDLFNQCIGKNYIMPGVYIGQQRRVPFGLCWRTMIGNDISNDAGYKIHIAPFLQASPSEDANNTINDSPEQKQYSWNSTAIPTNVGYNRNTSIIVLDSRWYDKNGLRTALTKIENILYGNNGNDPRIITLDEIEAIVRDSAASLENLLDNLGNFIVDDSYNPILTASYTV